MEYEVTIKPPSADVLFGVTDTAGDILVTDALDGVTVFDVRVTLSDTDELAWLVTFCENTSLDDSANGIELKL